MFEIQHDLEAYCWLKCQLEPQYQVIAEPQPGYFAEQLFCYRVFDGERLLHELQGDFRNLPPGTLIDQALEIVFELAGIEQEAA